ncbi:hypothetical protein [Hymenobacter lucidus]|uniref:Uncharacterized protein n=1 Tax=Hymenobacter lucidus TaxID=2880930 RepID=A0ABS8AWZ0_9BACT|nr:hypothetical protein [Hymenobacter lucidus]MCB2410325.1 hypothetical protein [Hymenobacter lucidus]
MLSSLIPAVSLSAIVFLYGYWLYQNRENIRYYLAPIGILLGCLLLAGLTQSYVFARAEVASYTAGEGMMSEMKYNEPNYTGEEIPLLLVFLGPVAGFVLLLLLLPRAMRRIQGVHYITLLLFVYPVLAIILLSTVGGSRPRFYEGQALPAVGTKVPTRP